MRISYRIVSQNESFKHKVRNVLNDKDGWNTYGFMFAEDDNAKFTIDLKPEEYIIKEYPQIKGLSGYLPDTESVLINETNWNYGHLKSCCNDMAEFSIDRIDELEHTATITQDQYRDYVINHEVGHHLQSELLKIHGGNLYDDNSEDIYHYRPRPDLTNNKMPVMMQLTKGKKNREPFEPNFKPLPITDKYHEFRNIIGPWRSIRGGDNTSKNKLTLSFLLVIILMLILVTYVTIYKKTREYDDIYDLRHYSPYYHY